MNEEKREVIERAAAEIEEKAGNMAKEIEERVGKATEGMGDNVKEIEEKVEQITENIGILNLKNATEEEIDQMGKIRNVGILLVPEALVSKISSKIVENVGIVVPFVDGMRIYGGKTKIDAATLQAFEEPIEFVQAGKLVFAKDVTPELVSEKIKGFRNYGKIEVPKNAYGAVMAKCFENLGKIAEIDEDD